MPDGVVHLARPPETVREEMADLRSYLAGLPREWREAGSFLAYEDKLNALDQELALGRIAELASTLNVLSTSGSDHPESGQGLLAILKESERQSAELASAYAKGSRWLNYATLVASAATVVGAVGSISALVVPAAVAAVGAAAAMALLRLPDRIREEAMLADYFMAIRNEATHLRQVCDLADPKLSPFATSARVEVLIAQILASRVRAGSRTARRLPQA